MSVKPIWSKHAKARRRLMGLTEHQVEAVIARPDMTYPMRPNGRFYVGNGLAIPVDRDGVIVTILWDGANGRDENGRATFD